MIEDDATLVVYGPFNYGGRYTSESNAAFDARLKAEDARQGLRDVEAVDALAQAIGFAQVEDRRDAGQQSHARLASPSDGVEDIDGGERRRAANAVPQEDRKTRVAGPQRVAKTAESRLVGLRLRYRVHRERAGARKPHRIARAPVERKERVAVAGRAVAEIRALA